MRVPPFLLLPLLPLALSTTGTRTRLSLPTARAGEAALPHGRALDHLVEEYLDAGFVDRTRLRAEADRKAGGLSASDAARLGKEMLGAASHWGPRVPRTGTSYFLGKDRGKVIVQGRPGKTLVLGLHGGGQGEGDAESAASLMGGGGWWWFFPEVLEKTERGWTSPGTEEFVIALIEAAKRSGKVDPDRLYIAGHSMGGFGAWTIGAHHADLFAGIGAYAGAPVPIWRSPADHTIVSIQDGVLPNLFALRLFVYQSGDDQNVPPQTNDFAMKTLEETWKKRFPDGFDFRYQRVDGRQHQPPQEGYLPSLRWLAEARRDAHPRKFLWQPALPWKRQFYWVAWDRPEIGALLEVQADGANGCDIRVLEGTADLTGLSVLVGPPLFDLAKEVVVRVNGKERFRGRVERRLSTLLLTLPRFDPELLYEARVDL